MWNIYYIYYIFDFLTKTIKEKEQVEGKQPEEAYKATLKSLHESNYNNIAPVFLWKRKADKLTTFLEWNGVHKNTLNSVESLKQPARIKSENRIYYMNMNCTAR